METMNYDKIKNKSNIGLISFVTFIVLGSGVVAYSLINEEQPRIIGENPLVEVSSPNVVDKEEKKEINYTITNVSRTNNDSSYKSNITLPVIKIDEVDLTDINEEIKQRFLNKYDVLQENSDENFENEFLYKVNYKKYETKVEDTTLLSLVFEETITAGKTNTFSSKNYTYVIDLTQKKVLSQDEAAPLILGYAYRNKIKDDLKTYVIDNNIQGEEDYNYSITGLEEFYIKEEEFHMVFNPAEPFDEKHGIIDIIINK
ncbi:MAG: hypothetical protein IKV94_01615 [Clostridia bacterium]|nr:hypothetical protein [Clostridia bacterium]